MTSEYWPRCPLGIIAHHFRGTSDIAAQTSDEDTTDDKVKRDRGLSNLRLFRRLIQHESSAEQFRKILSPEQAASWNLLDEWLRGLYLPGALSNIAAEAIESDDFAPSKWFSRRSEFSTGNRQLHESYYQHWLLNLYQVEFIPMSVFWHTDAQEEALRSLHNDRLHAQSYAMCHQVAHRWYGSQLSTQTLSGTTNPPVMMNETLPWLSNAPDKDEMPYYLWDTSAKRTVVVHELFETPRYSCVSHTWGRWRLPNLVVLQGVPWKVPGNKLFKVKTLPKILKDCADYLKTRYIWFDLVCIPQEDTQPELAKLSKQEISRQSLIFRNAESCAAWLNYVDDWQAEKATLDYWSRLFLVFSTPDQQYPIEESLKGSKEDAGRGLQLLVHPSHDKYLNPSTFLSKIKSRFLPSSAQAQPENWKDQVTLSVWFTSLWTLQEAYLRPDMILMNRQLEPLCDSAGSIFTLAMMTTFGETLDELYRNVQDLSKTLQDFSSTNEPAEEGSRLTDVPTFRYTAEYPQGPTQLRIICEDMKRSDLSRAQILVQSNNRQCTSRRAEAIMSVLDVRVWFLDPTAHHQLVLGMYPLKFVNEARQKIGPDFYLAKKRNVSFTAYHFGHARGSMLPFAPLDPQALRGQDNVTMYPFRASDSCPHPSVPSWSLDISGVFRIKKAAVLAASTGPATPDFPIEVVWNCLSSGVDEHDVGDIKKWVKQQPRQLRTFAINISRNVGLILQSRNPQTRPLELIKVGCYEVFDRVDEDHLSRSEDWLDSQPVDWVPTREVDWIVL